MRANKEKWKKVEEVDDYQVNNLGKIRNKHTKHVLKPYRSCSGTGYEMVDLIVYRNNERFKLKRLIHRIVCFAFVPGFSIGLEVNHLDGNKFNNSATNLAWVSRSQNMIHAFENGLNHVGSKHGISKLNEAQVLEIKQALKKKTGKRSFPLYSDLALAYGVDRKTISYIHQGVTWRHVHVA